jgi:hypothetical protein
MKIFSSPEPTAPNFCLDLAWSALRGVRRAKYDKFLSAAAGCPPTARSGIDVSQAVWA